MFYLFVTHVDKNRMYVLLRKTGLIVKTSKSRFMHIILYLFIFLQNNSMQMQQHTHFSRHITDNKFYSYVMMKLLHVIYHAIPNVQLVMTPFSVLDRYN